VHRPKSKARHPDNPSKKLHKAIGQMVRTASNIPPGWHAALLWHLIAEYRSRSRALEKLGISGLALADHPLDDRFLFGNFMPCP